MTLLDSLLGTPPWVHTATCPCGASVTTDSAVLAQKFVELHNGHTLQKEPPPKTPTA